MQNNLFWQFKPKSSVPYALNTPADSQQGRFFFFEQCTDVFLLQETWGSVVFSKKTNFSSDLLDVSLSDLSKAVCVCVWWGGDYKVKAWTTAGIISGLLSRLAPVLVIKVETRIQHFVPQHHLLAQEPQGQSDDAHFLNLFPQSQMFIESLLCTRHQVYKGTVSASKSSHLVEKTDSLSFSALLTVGDQQGCNIVSTPPKGSEV